MDKSIFTSNNMHILSKTKDVIKKSHMYIITTLTRKIKATKLKMSTFFVVVVFQEEMNPLHFPFPISSIFISFWEDKQNGDDTHFIKE